MQTLMSDLGMAGQKFKAKIKVYEPNAQVSVSKKGGGGGVSVNSNLGGKSIGVKEPKMEGRSADGSMEHLGGIHKVGENGSFSAMVKGSATGIEAAKQTFTKGDGSISIPGTQGN